MRHDLVVGRVIHRCEADNAAGKLRVARAHMRGQLVMGRTGTKDQPFLCRFQLCGDLVVERLVRRVLLALDRTGLVVELMMRKRGPQGMDLAHVSIEEEDARLDMIEPGGGVI